MAIDPRIEAALAQPLKGRPSRDTIVPVNAPVPKGYGGVPGSGPMGTSCAQCKHCCPTGSDYRNWVCDRPRRGCDRGTFINRYSRSCGKFAERSRERK